MQYQFAVQLGSDVANGGTFDHTLPEGISNGSFSYARPAADEIRWNGKILTSSFGLSFATAGVIRFTNNTGVTLKQGQVVNGYLSINGIAGSKVSERVCVVGSGHGNHSKWSGAEVKELRFALGILEATSATHFVATQAVTASTLTITVQKELKAAREISFTTSNAGNTTQTVTVYGRNNYGKAVQQTKTANGTSTVLFGLGMAYVEKVVVSAALTGTISVGITDNIEYPVLNSGEVGFEAEVLTDGTAAGAAAATTTGTPGSTTATQFGMYTPNASDVPDGSLAFTMTFKTTNAGYIGEDVLV